MIAKIIDNQFDQQYLYNIYQALNDELDYKANNIANRKTWPFGDSGSHRLLGCTLFERKSLNRCTVLHDKAQPFFDMFERICSLTSHEYYLQQIFINLQHSGCDGSSHIDSIEGTSDELTIMVFPNPEWCQEWGGQFQILDKDRVIETHEYKPGRIIIFPAYVSHRGLGPSVDHPHLYRYSIVFRVRT